MDIMCTIANSSYWVAVKDSFLFIPEKSNYLNQFTENFSFNQARLKTSRVPGPAGGRKSGQLGGRNVFSLFFLYIFFLVWFGRKILSFKKKKKFFGKNVKKSSQLPLFNSPGRWTGNLIFF